jgi:hypothetical protein
MSTSHLSRDHLWVISGITLEGKLLMVDQERSFKSEDVVRFLRHLLGQIPGKLLVSSGTDLSDTSRRSGLSRTFWAAGPPRG